MSHTSTAVQLPPQQEQYSTSIFRTNPSLECLKQLEKRATPTPFPPPRLKTEKKQKKSCFCQASTEYTAFHFIKTIIQKPAKNYIKLPPCTTPSPFLQPLLPTNSLPALQGQNHSTGPCSKPLTAPWLSQPTHSIFQSQAQSQGAPAHPASQELSEFHITTATPRWSAPSRFLPDIWWESSIQHMKRLTNPTRKMNDNLRDFFSNSHQSF